MKEPVGQRLKDIRLAVVALAGLATAAEDIFLFAEIGETADEEIEAAVVVVVEPHGAGGPSRRTHTCLGGDVGEGAVAVVPIENAVGILRDVQVRQSVTVVVADSYAHSIGVARNAGFGGDIRK